jgi:predicted GTPase
MLIGNTKVGKSWMIEELVSKCSEDVALDIVGDAGGESTTVHVTEYSVEHQSLGQITLVDTPGLADTKGRTLDMVDAIATQAKEYKQWLPVLVVNYSAGFTAEYRFCLEALELCLQMRSQDYVLVVNQIQMSRSDRRKCGDAKQQEAKIQQNVNTIAEKVAAALLRAPLRVVQVNYNDEQVSLDSLVCPVSSSGVVRSLSEMIELTRSDKAKLDSFRKTIEAFEKAPPEAKRVYRFMESVSGIRNTVGSIVRNTAGVLVSSLVCVAGILEHRLTGSEYIYRGIELWWRRLSPEDKKFVDANFEAVTMLWTRLIRVHQYYNQTIEPGPEQF